jgi:hypothetical protein
LVVVEWLTSREDIIVPEGIVRPPEPLKTGELRLLLSGEVEKIRIGRHGWLWIGGIERVHGEYLSTGSVEGEFVGSQLILLMLYIDHADRSSYPGWHDPNGWTSNRPLGRKVDPRIGAMQGQAIMVSPYLKH